MRRPASRWPGLVASTANVLLLDEPTNNLDPASREQVLDALRSYLGAVVLVTHDPGAAEALDPQRVVLLPDGTEDFWSDGLPRPHRTGLSRHRAALFGRILPVVGLGLSYAGYSSGHQQWGGVDEETEQNPGSVADELRSAYEGGASIRSLVASTGRSYGSIHSMLRESGTTMRSRGGPNHRTPAR